MPFLALKIAAGGLGDTDANQPTPSFQNFFDKRAAFRTVVSCFIFSIQDMPEF